jgi:hypothetical protein
MKGLVPNGWNRQQDLPKTRQSDDDLSRWTANERGIDAGPVDGLWGSRTSAAFDELAYRIENGNSAAAAWRPDEISVPNPNSWPVQHTPEFYEFFGDRSSQSRPCLIFRMK